MDGHLLYACIFFLLITWKLLLIIPTIITVSLYYVKTLFPVDQRIHTLCLTRRWRSFTTKSVFYTDMILKPLIKQHWHIYCSYIMRLIWSIMWLTLYCNMKIMHNLSMGIFSSAHIFPFILLIHHLYSKQLPMTLHHGSFWKLLEAYFNPLHLWCGAKRQRQSKHLKV